MSELGIILMLICLSFYGAYYFRPSANEAHLIKYEAKLRAEYQKIAKEYDHGEALIDARIKALEEQDYA